MRKMQSRILWILSVAIAMSLGGPNLPAQADYRLSQTWFEALPPDARADIQGNLVLLAQYGGLVDAQFGPGTYNAIVAWQKSAQVAPNGVADQSQLESIEQSAAQAMSDLGMDLVDDLGGRLAIMLPMGLLPERRIGPNGSVYQDLGGGFSVETLWRDSSEGSLANHYQNAVSPRPGAAVTYSALKPDLYVVTGTLGDRFFYELFHAAKGGVAGFRFIYDEEYRQVGGVASVFAASYSAPTDVVANLQMPDTATPPPAASTVELPNEAATAGKDKQRKAIPDQTLQDGVNVFGSFMTFDSSPGVLALFGEIGPKTPLDLRRALNSMESPKLLVLASDGGNVASALMVAYEVAELELSTTILPDTGCYSACAFVFLAGKERLAEGELGVHQVWGESADASSAQTVVSDILEAFSEFNVAQQVTSAMLRTVPEEMYVFSEMELARWGINSPSW